jgi:hypothetical protein
MDRYKIIEELKYAESLWEITVKPRINTMVGRMQDDEDLCNAVIDSVEIFRRIAQTKASSSEFSVNLRDESPVTNHFEAIKSLPAA